MSFDSIKSSVEAIVGHRRIVILGFGLEGKSTLNFLNALSLDNEIVIADSNANLSKEEILNVSAFFLGPDYLNAIKSGDFLMKTPGISFRNFSLPAHVVISSQTDLFLQLFRNQVVGITGTKGKSTTSSLAFHILKSHFNSVFLVGNIGVPALDIAFQMTENSMVVYEMSSHQLEFVTTSPSRAVLLNFHQEHLDHYTDYQGYRKAKWQILRHQHADDFFVFNIDDSVLKADLQSINIVSQPVPIALVENIESYFFFSSGNIIFNGKSVGFQREKFNLRGNHNIFNLMVCLAIANTFSIPVSSALQSAYSFHGLSHRLEYVGVFNGIHFYNDSIATIPEAAINALKSVDETATIILGGFDRGIDYQPLIDFLLGFKPINLILMGKVGERLCAALENNYKGKIFKVTDLKTAVEVAFAQTTEGKACLLSPAAASYDSFKNFEDRGNQFVSLVKSSFQ